MMARKTTPKNKKPSSQPRVAIRFSNEDDYDLVRRAAEVAKLSMNTWLIRISLMAARKELAKGELV